MNGVKWGSFRLGDLFDIENTWVYGKNKQYESRYDNYIDRSLSIISGITINNGVNYWTTDELNDDEIFEDCLTISTRGEYSGTVTYHNERFALANNILTMPMPGWSKNSKLFIASLIGKIGYGGYSGYPRKETLKDDSILLPVTEDDEIDFDFMESFIRELEEERIEKLCSFLDYSGLSDCTLTEQENSVLGNFVSLNWKEFCMDDLFDIISTKKLPYKAKDLPTSPLGENVLPCLTSSFQNQGLNYYAPKDNATILKNVISIPSNSDVYRAYYQSKDFTVLSDSYAIKLKDKINANIDIENLFLVRCINMVTDLPIYSYKNKLGGWNKVKNKKIFLPVKNGKIDFEYMRTFIRAIEKLVIKDVVLYADRKIEAAKKVVENNDSL